jgi:hypothetical protein
MKIPCMLPVVKTFKFYSMKLALQSLIPLNIGYKNVGEKYKTWQTMTH